MGLFTLCVSVVLVVLQATVILLGRDESAWSFRLVRATVDNATVYEDADILPPWNPHLLLLVLCGMQSLFAFARRQTHVPQHPRLMLDEGLPLSLTTVFLALLLAACIAAHAIRDAALVQYPTLVTIGGLLLGMGWFLWQHSKHCHDDGFWAWAVACHMQGVAMPLAALSFALFGSRQWTDLVSLCVLLSASVNLVWIQLWRVGEVPPPRLCRVLIAALVTFCLYVGHVQFGPLDTWRYVMASMGCAGLAVPAYLACVIGPPSGKRERDHHALSLMVCNASLLSMVVALSQLR